MKYDLIPPGEAYYTLVVLGLAAALGIISSTLPLLKRIMGPEVMRNSRCFPPRPHRDGAQLWPALSVVRIRWMSDDHLAPSVRIAGRFQGRRTRHQRLMAAVRPAS
ncbi:hypothetical protein [Frankia sp. CiP3]|uniref:hypothetical protein n=1 Tax=Frankia sp. CiP3 TaxID=2880971 RepID=UPI001EF45EA2|nr:hypothetical protein [Frankia sp. CiP3]